MNTLTGNIIEICTEGSLSLVKIVVHHFTLSSIIIDTPEQSEYLRVGKKVKVLFKETEVILAKEFSGKISVQNKIECRVTSFEKGTLLCKIALYINGDTITSIITRNAFEQLNINENDTVIAMIKTNEISLSAHD